MSDDVRGCGCQLQEGESSGNGWHFIISGERFCWDFTAVNPSNGERVRPYIRKHESRMENGSTERVTQCLCARRIEVINPDGSGKVLHEAMPRCNMVGQKVMTERCPAYWQGAGRSISPYDKRELAPIYQAEEDKRGRKKDKFTKALDGQTPRRDDDIPF